jgi:AbrB family looped-hinge helix DNA binding protein
MAVFKTKLVKWGNSVGVVIPKAIRQTFDLDATDEVEIIDKQDHFIVRKGR